MKCLKVIVIIFIFTLPIFSFGASVPGSIIVSPYKAFGGRIVNAPLPGANCPEDALNGIPTSPFNVLPSGFLVPGPFAETPGTLTNGAVLTGVWALGLYLSAPIPECEVGIPPAAAPLPVFPTFIFGTGLPIPRPSHSSYISL